MLRFLGVSRSRYHAFLHRKLSISRQYKDSIKQILQEIYNKSKQNYDVPKIIHKLCKLSIRIFMRMVGLYMKEMDIWAQWIKPWTTTTRNFDFSSQLYNILDEHFNPKHPGFVWRTILPILGQITVLST